MKILYSKTFSSNMSSNLTFDSWENCWNVSLGSRYSSMTSDALKFWMIRYWYFNFLYILLNTLRRLTWENESSLYYASISLLLFWFERYKVLEMIKSRFSRFSRFLNSSECWDIILKKSEKCFIIIKYSIKE